MIQTMIFDLDGRPVLTEKLKALSYEKAADPQILLNNQWSRSSVKSL